MIRFSRQFRKKGVFVLSAWIALAGTGVDSMAQQDLMDFDHSLKFARYLNSSNQFSFAAEEYERLHHFYPQDTLVLFELVKNYRIWENCGQLYRSRELFSTYGKLSNPLYTREYLNYCLTCRSADPGYLSLARGLGGRNEAFYMLSYYWRTRQFDSAFVYNRLQEPVLKTSYKPIYALTLEFEEQNYKSPVLAMMMSAVIPGSGRAYSKRWRDAVISFVMIGTTAYASYRAFSQKGISSFNGWLVGGISFSFYVSNLYGSFRAARQYNQQIVTRYEDEARDLIYRYY